MLKWFRPYHPSCCVTHFRCSCAGREHLNSDNPYIIVANHNSHLDTLVLMSLFPLGQIHRIRPVAAADYFMKNRLIAWFSTQFIGIIPLSRKVERSQTNPLEPLRQALKAGDSIILFPEGSRGEAEQMSKFKSGVAHLAKMTPDTPVIPIYLGGAGKVLPKGEALLVPFIIVFISITYDDR
jgi:1-acyl-sn-glycerol-3-phosphate acyltransferase